MIIGLTGYKQVGKDTVADYLVERHGFIRIAFADKLKEAIANLLNISIEQVDRWKNEDKKIVVFERDYPSVTVTEPMYWREFLQRFGTEMGRRTFGDDFWIDQLFTSGQFFIQDHRDIVISDCRFENEALAIQEVSGKVIEITRPGYESDGHASEVPIDPSLIGARIENNGTLNYLRGQVDDVLEALRANV